MSKATTARDAAAYIVRQKPRISWVHLQALLYIASMEHYRDHGSPIFAEVFYAERTGPVVRSVTREWLRGIRRTMSRNARRFRALRSCVRRWGIQEKMRARSNMRRINMPGGWGERDAMAQIRGLHDAGFPVPT